jgi:hypothetical protein
LGELFVFSSFSFPLLKLLKALVWIWIIDET